MEGGGGVRRYRWGGGSVGCVWMVDVLPVYALDGFLGWDGEGGGEVGSTCDALARSLAETGVVVVKDPRVSYEDHEVFMDVMERYFDQPMAKKEGQIRAELSYQVGLTPEGVEVPWCMADPECLTDMESMDEAQRPTRPTGADPKERYFWRIGERPAETQFAELNAEPVVPDGFEGEWARKLDAWGGKMLATAETVAEMAAVGYGLGRNAFKEWMHQGPHLLAPTGSNMGKWSTPGMVLAGYHYDLNFLTIHGKSRYPGLFIWLRDGRRVPVSVPDGCLLVQAGKQLEWATAGHVKAGFHEVVVTERAVELAAANRVACKSLWRISSTVFAHVASDGWLRPLGRFAEADAAKGYPPTLAGKYVEEELEKINLKKKG